LIIILTLHFGSECFYTALSYKNGDEALN